MVIVATLEPAPVFAWYAAMIVPLPVPDGVTVHQAWSLDEVHAILDATSKLVVPEADGTFLFNGRNNQ